MNSVDVFDAIFRFSVQLKIDNTSLLLIF